MNSDLFAIVAGTIVIYGVSTGLQPPLLFAGAAGGWLAVTYIEELRWYDRANRVFLSALAAAWSTLAVVKWMGLTNDVDIAKYPVALVIGLLTMDVLGKGIIRAARKWFADRHG